MNAYPKPIEEIRTQEFPQLQGMLYPSIGVSSRQDSRTTQHTNRYSGKAYFDHAGSQLPPTSLIEAFCDDLKTNLYGNPHSESMPSKAAGHRVDEVRARTLAFFGADSNEYDLIFVANATAAIKLVCDGFRDYRDLQVRRHCLFKRSSKRSDFYVYYHRDAHTSLVSLREFSSHQKCFSSDADVESWIDGLSSSSSTNNPPTLFAYPGQSNMTGRRLPPSWPSRIKAASNSSHIYTLLDAAALATTKRLDISTWQPDFVALSFYKIFGFPDLGALLVRRATGGPILDARRYFGGGTVDIVAALGAPWHVKKEETSLHDRHEDGTQPFHNIIALGHALDAIDRVYGGMDAISLHTAWLTRILHTQIASLRHSNGISLIRFYNDRSAVYGDTSVQGATIAFSVMTPAGTMVSYQAVEAAADKIGIYVRSGSLCNPGGVASYLGWTSQDLRHAYAAGHRCSAPIEFSGGRTTGVVRVSLGACSSVAECEALVTFLRETYVDVINQQAQNVSTHMHEMQSKERSILMRVRAAPAAGRKMRINQYGRSKEIPTREDSVMGYFLERQQTNGAPWSDKIEYDGETPIERKSGRGELLAKPKRWIKGMVEFWRSPNAAPAT
jgi:molybdenum cofactor sulfurtransferase